MLTKFEKALLVDVWSNVDFFTDPVSSISKSRQKDFFVLSNPDPK